MKKFSMLVLLEAESMRKEIKKKFPIRSPSTLTYSNRNVLKGISLEEIHHPFLPIMLTK